MSTVLDIGCLAGAAPYSFAGLRNAVRREEAFRQELIAGAILAPAAMWLRDSGIKRAALLGSLMLVLIVELMNSAIEATADRIGTERNELSARAIDLASPADLTLPAQRADDMRSYAAGVGTRGLVLSVPARHTLRGLDLRLLRRAAGIHRLSTANETEGDRIAQDD